MKNNNEINEINKKLEINIDFLLPFKNYIYYNILIICLLSNNMNMKYLVTIYYFGNNYCIRFFNNS